MNEQASQWPSHDPLTARDACFKTCRYLVSSTSSLRQHVLYAVLEIQTRWEQNGQEGAGADLDGVEWVIGEVNMLPFGCGSHL
jgi:hypothetical protein